MQGKSNESKAIQEKEIKIASKQKIEILTVEVYDLKKYRISADKKICELNKEIKEKKKEINELKNYTISSDEIKSELIVKETIRLYKEISELKNHIISSNEIKSELLEKISGLNNKIKAMKEDSRIKESCFKKILEENRVKHSNSTLQLKKDIEEIKAINNSLNMKLRNSNDNNETLEQELLQVKNNSLLDINNLNNKLKEEQIINNNTNAKLKLIENRDTSKFVIDFIYSILLKKYDASIKFEDKVDYICKEIKKIKINNDSNFPDSFCKFLNKIMDEKKKEIKWLIRILYTL